MDLKTIKAFIFDLDGVIFLGDKLLPGAKKLIDHFNEQNTPYLFLTNNSSRLPEETLKKLTDFDLNISIENILSAGMITVSWLDNNFQKDRGIYVFGTESLKKYISLAGYNIVDSEDADLVIGGINFDINYDNISKATLALNNGAQFIATNMDRNYPTEKGLLAGNGSMLQVLIHASRREPDLIIGKPSPIMFQEALKILKLQAHEVAMVGDQYETDILGADSVGMNKIAVLTGVDNKDKFKNAEAKTDLVIENLEDLLSLVK